MADPTDPRAPRDPAHPETDPAAQPGRGDAVAPPSGSAQAAVEAPDTRKGTSSLVWIVVAVLAVGLLFYLFAGGAEEAVEAVDPATVTVTD